MKIEVLDSNDHDPKFNQSLYYFNVSENDESNVTGISVGVVSATDEDPGDNGRITYNIISVDGQDLFVIDQVKIRF